MNRRYRSQTDIFTRETTIDRSRDLESFSVDVSLLNHRARILSAELIADHRCFLTRNLIPMEPTEF